jgi:hypothetical protein
MKKYKVVKPEGLEDNDEAFDLVNVNDPTDIIMCAPDEFTEGEIINENDIYFDKGSYVYNDGVATGTFAYKYLNEHKIHTGTKQIAEFMNVEYVLNDHKTGKPFYVNLNYHSSWDTLIPVYSKIMENTPENPFTECFPEEKDHYDNYDLQTDFEDAVYNNRILLAFHVIVRRLKQLKLEKTH